VTAPNTTASSPAADLEDEDRGLEEFEAKAGRRSARRVRVLGGLAAGAAFLGTLILSPSYRDAGAWGLAIVAAAAVVVICHVGVRLAARPGRHGPRDGTAAGLGRAVAGLRTAPRSCLVNGVRVEGAGATRRGPARTLRT
jgi:hypothetical protein